MLRSQSLLKELNGRIPDMSKVFSAHAVSVDGYITGRDPGAARGLRDAPVPFFWYGDGDGDTPSRLFDGFRLSEPSARVFDDLAGRVGAVVAGRNTYEDSDRFGGGSPHPAAPLFVLSHRPAPGWPSRRPWSPPASRTRSRQPAPPPGARTSASWAAGS
jgi:hypothetical protein